MDSTTYALAAQAAHINPHRRLHGDTRGSTLPLSRSVTVRASECGTLCLLFRSSAVKVDYVSSGGDVRDGVLLNGVLLLNDRTVV